jgi:hypothetical protein
MVDAQATSKPPFVHPELAIVDVAGVRVSVFAFIPMIEPSGDQ